jgi:hypothetical protein
MLGRAKSTSHYHSDATLLYTTECEGASREGASLSEEAHCGGARGKAPLLGTLGYERKALETGISLHGDPVGQPGVGSSTGTFERWLKGALELERLSLSLSLSLSLAAL